MIYDDTDMARRLDELRLDLLTDLSHQLRTPITAMRLALDGLFDTLGARMNDSERGLADVSRRNLDRIVTLVEKQLALLRLAVGDSPVARHLVDLPELVNAIATEVTGDPLRSLSLAIDDTVPRYVFTDPRALGTLVSTVLFGGPPRCERRLAVRYSPETGEVTLDIYLRFLNPGRDTDTAPVTEPGVHGNSGLSVVSPLSRIDFECRAYSDMSGLLGGGAAVEKDDDEKRVIIRLPVFPEFDTERDFVNPVRRIRHLSETRNERFVMVRCDLRGDFHGEGAMTRGLCDFIERSCNVLIGGDVLLRGRAPGSVFLALRDRTEGELGRIRNYLTRGDRTDDGVRAEWSPLTLLDDRADCERLLAAADTL